VFLLKSLVAGRSGGGHELVSICVKLILPCTLGQERQMAFDDHVLVLLQRTFSFPCSCTLRFFVASTFQTKKKNRDLPNNHGAEFQTVDGCHLKILRANIKKIYFSSLHNVRRQDGTAFLGGGGKCWLLPFNNTPTLFVP